MLLTLKRPSHVSITIILLLILNAAPIEAGELSPEMIRQYSAMDPFSFIS